MKIIINEIELRKIVSQVVKDVVYSGDMISKKSSIINEVPEVIIAANWKMNKSFDESEDFFQNFNSLLPTSQNIHVIICPPFHLLFPVLHHSKRMKFHLGAQNMHYASKGAYTGEISPQMLHDAGCTYVIIGHSERRQLFNETDTLIANKIESALEIGLRPILCIGETQDQRRDQLTFPVLKSQIRNSLLSVRMDKISNVIIAYEPIWAIGTGDTATPEQVQKVHSFIRETFTSLYNFQIAESLRILYGGSVTSQNASDLIRQSDVNGFLIGGASLDPNQFNQIIETSQEIQ